MKTYSPIKNRTSDELLEIVSNPEDWIDDVKIEAEQELVNRGISLEKQKFQESISTKRKRKIKTIKENASYPVWYKVFMVMFPFFAITRFFDNGESIVSLEENGFYRKSKERVIYLILGLILWILLLIIFNNEIMYLSRYL